jgi:hypothetical protein
VSPTNVTWGNPTAQWGSATEPGDVWATEPFSDAVTVLLDGTAGIDRRVGVIFDAALQQTFRFDASGNLLDGPILTGFTLRATYAAVTAFEGGGPDQRAELLLVPEAGPVDFASGTLAPLNRGELSLGSFTLPLGAFPDIQVVDFAFPTAGALLGRAHVTSRSQWRGRIALTLRSLGANTFRLHNGPTNPMRLLTVQEPFFQGLAGGPTGPRIRVVRDSRFGMPALNTELIRDGDQPNLWVRSSDWDPEDEPARYRPRPGEGTVDDDIPNL